MVFKPGQSGNPLGRPKGSKNRLSEATYDALAADFEEFGVDAIARVRAMEPASYLRFIASVLPKELEVAVTGRPGGLDTGSMRLVIGILHVLAEVRPNATDDELLQFVTAAVRAHSAPQIEAVAETVSVSGH